MKEVIRIFKEIQVTSSLNDKKRIITENKDNELFKKCLKFLLDDNVITGISDKKINKRLNIRVEYELENTFENCMNYLKQNNTGTDIDIGMIQIFVNSQPEEHREFYKQMITKKFKLGVDSKTVNKCIPNLIPVFNVMLGTPIEKCKLKENEWIAITHKLNGCRCVWIGNKFMTRQGKEYKGLDHIANYLSQHMPDVFIDGELIYKNKEGLSDSEAFQKGTGIAMSKDKNKSELKFIVFDAFPLNEFWSGKSNYTYRSRRAYLNVIENKFLKEFPTENIEVVPVLYQGTDHSQIWKWLDYAEEHDWEGVMLNLDALYECKRVKTLIKVKKFMNCDVKCIDIEEGSGRNKRTLGAIVCDYKGYKVNVGSGFTDEQRKYYWDKPSEIIGHIVSVKYKEETKNKDGGISIQFPVFESVRFDKTEPSYN